MATIYRQCKDCPRSFLIVYHDGPPQERCDECRAKRIRKQARERVRRYRANKKPKVIAQKRSTAFHMTNGSGGTACGAPPNSENLIRWCIKHPGEKWHVCKRCQAIYSGKTAAGVTP